MDAYEVQSKISKAIYGDIILAKDIKTGRNVAIKRIDMSHVRRKKSLMEKTVKEDPVQECRLVRQLSKQGNRAFGSDANQHESSPPIVQLENDFEENGMLYLVFEHCVKGDLLSYMKTLPKERYSIQLTQKYFLQIVKAVAFIHEKGVAHRDISLENILLSDKDECKLCDFGLALECNGLAKGAVGKRNYMAPELFAQEEYDGKQADLWSLGIVLYMMLTGKTCVERAVVDDARYVELVELGVSALLSGDGIRLPSHCLQLMNALLVVDPECRLSLDRILNHSFFFFEPPAKKLSCFSFLAKALSRSAVQPK